MPKRTWLKMGKTELFYEILSFFFSKTFSTIFIISWNFGSRNSSRNSCSVISVFYHSWPAMSISFIGNQPLQPSVKFFIKIASSPGQQGTLLASCSTFQRPGWRFSRSFVHFRAFCFGMIFIKLFYHSLSSSQVPTADSFTNSLSVLIRSTSRFYLI